MRTLLVFTILLFSFIFCGQITYAQNQQNQKSTKPKEVEINNASDFMDWTDTWGFRAHLQKNEFTFGLSQKSNNDFVIVARTVPEYISTQSYISWSPTGLSPRRLEFECILYIFDSSLDGNFIGNEEHRIESSLSIEYRLTLDTNDCTTKEIDLIMKTHQSKIPILIRGQLSLSKDAIFTKVDEGHYMINLMLRNPVIREDKNHRDALVK
jgi:hypothetical protein